MSDDILGATPSQPEGLGANPPDFSQSIENIVQPVVNTAENVVAGEVGDIQMISVASSDILAAGYDPIGARAQIQFNNNRIYVFSNISPLDWEGFITSPSKGKYFWQWRRNPVQFPFVRVQ